MVGIFILLAAATADIEACEKAVHGDIVKAVTACDASGEKIDLFKPGGMTDACLAAFKAGQQAGRFGPSLPAASRAGLIRAFDKKLEACRAPKQESTPTRKTLNLWD